MCFVSVQTFSFRSFIWFWLVYSSQRFGAFVSNLFILSFSDHLFTTPWKTPQTAMMGDVICRPSWTNVYIFCIITLTSPPPSSYLSFLLAYLCFVHLLLFKTILTTEDKCSSFPPFCSTHIYQHTCFWKKMWCDDLCAEKKGDRLKVVFSPVFSPDIILHGWLGSKYQLTN